MIRASPVAARTSRNRAGKLVRPLASMACSKCPRNMFPPLNLPVRGLLRHYLPLYPTNHGTQQGDGVSIGPPVDLDGAVTTLFSSWTYFILYRAEGPGDRRGDRPASRLGRASVLGPSGSRSEGARGWAGQAGPRLRASRRLDPSGPLRTNVAIARLTPKPVRETHATRTGAWARNQPRARAVGQTTTHSRRNAR